MNHTWARKTVQTGAIAAGAVLVAGAGAAHATESGVTTTDQVGAVNGNQVVAPIQAPINICGVAATVLGTADASCEGGSSAFFGGPNGDLTTKNNTGLGNGNQVYAPIQAPVDVCGIAASVAGVANADCEGGSTATIPGSGSGRHAESAVTSKDNIGALSGNQILAPIQAPVDVCGNAASVGGVANAECEGGSSAYFGGPAGGMTTKDNVGLGNGNQVYAPIQAPINVCGNAIAILGTANASCEGGSDAEIDKPKPKPDNKKKPGHKESSAEAANYSAQEQLPTGGLPGLDSVGGATDMVSAGLPVDADVVDDVLANTAPVGVGSLTGVAGL